MHRPSCGCSSMAEPLPSKQDMGVRFPSPALMPITDTTAWRQARAYGELAPHAAACQPLREGITGL
jgi:hypothetical protein